MCVGETALEPKSKNWNYNPGFAMGWRWALGKWFSFLCICFLIGKMEIIQSYQLLLNCSEDATRMYMTVL